MKVLADTNILFSALLYPNGGPGRALKHIATHHELVLSDYNIKELRLQRPIALTAAEYTERYG
jgi:predicted nucleic acid-binding protein